MAYGVTTDGFVKKTVNIIIDEMKVKAQSEFGADIDLQPTSALYHFLEIIAMEEAVLWDLCEDMYYAAFIEFATGDNLDRVIALLGLERKYATKATGTQSFTATQPLTVSAGSIVQTDTGIEYVTDEDLVFVGASTDTVAITAVEPGTDSNVAADTLTILKDPITGINSTTNASAISNGTDAETDSELRARAKLYSKSLGKGTVDAIVNAVLAVSGVTSVSASEDFDLHKLTLTVAGVASPDSTVDAAIEDTRPAGIEVIWQNPTGVDIWVDATVDVTGDAPGDADTQIQTMIVNYINGLDVGDDVIYKKVVDEIFNADDGYTEAWILDITALTVDDVDPPVGTSNVVIAASEKAQTIAAKIDVTVT